MGKTLNSSERLQALFLRYIQNYGQSWIGYYSFTGCARPSFISFMDSLRITLIRLNMVPAYLWQYEPARDQYEVVLFTNGYFRSGMDDIASVITRLWQLRSNVPFQFNGSIFADRNNFTDTQTRLIMLADKWQSYQSGSWHQRCFGASMQT